jgi:hypothetical protein
MYRHSTVFFSFVVVARLLAGLCLARDAAPAAARTQPRTPPRAPPAAAPRGRGRLSRRLRYSSVGGRALGALLLWWLSPRATVGGLAARPARASGVYLTKGR